jgi:DNA-binding CsgD family transcriptional regulator
MPDDESPPLLERERELRVLGRLAADACRGSGRMVLIEGPPGLGKTRLLHAVRDEGRRHGALVLSARATDLEHDFPFGVVRQLFDPLLGAQDPRRRATLLRGAARLAEPLLGGAPPAEEPAAADAAGQLHALYWLIANLAESAPVVLSVDDLHWADGPSLRFLQFLLPRLAELPVLVALAARPPEPGADRRAIDGLATDPLAVVLRPEPLSTGAVEALAGELGRTVEVAFAEACREATGGNPLLLRELLRHLAAEGLAPTAANAPIVRQVAPPTVGRAVLLRLARLGEEAWALAGAVAVLGDHVPLRRASALAELPPERGGELAAALAHAHVLTRARPLEFVHPIVRAAVYAEIEPGERAAAHRRAARLLAEEGARPDEVAVHLLATEPAGDPEVATTLCDAARRAVGRGAAATAATCLRRALAEPPAPDDRGTLLFELAAAEVHAGDPGSAAEHFQEALRFAVDPRSRTAYVEEHALALFAAGRRQEAFELFDRTGADVAAVDPEAALRLEGHMVGVARLERRRLGWARERLARHGGRLAGATPGERLLLATQAHIEAFSPRSEASADELADAAERALASGGLLDEARAGSPPFFFAVDVLLLADRLGAARAALDAAVEDARRRGSGPAFAFALSFRCGLSLREGALADAEADARSAGEVLLEQGWYVARPNLLGSQVAVLVERGELEDAARLLERSGINPDAMGDEFGLARVLHARARLRAARGDVAGARADLERVAPRRARWNTYPTLVPPVLLAPQLAPPDPDEARMLAEQTLRDARTWGTPRAVGMALHAAALMPGERRTLELLRDAAAVLEQSPAPLERARALLDLGAALRRSNRRAEARDPLRRALDLAESCGAAPLAQRARQELRSAGGRPRRPRLSGIDALTATEQRIAHMAADGLSNPEIAQALFVTTKTVESHLSNVYRKLDIQSRTQLAAALPGFERHAVR